MGCTTYFTSFFYRDPVCGSVLTRIVMFQEVACPRPVATAAVRGARAITTPTTASITPATTSPSRGRTSLRENTQASVRQTLSDNLGIHYLSNSNDSECVYEWRMEWIPKIVKWLFLESWKLNWNIRGLKGVISRCFVSCSLIVGAFSLPMKW